MHGKYILTWSKLEPEPDRHGHDAVVDHVQRGHVLVLLAQYKEQSVRELRELAEVVPPACIRHLNVTLRFIPKNLHSVAYLEIFCLFI